MILVGIDGTEESLDALTWAIKEADLRDTEVRAIMAYDIPWTIVFSGSYTEADYRRGFDKIFQEIVHRVEADHPGAKLDMELVKRKPALALVEASEDAEMLVVGSHSYGPLKGFHVGSVASYCASHAHCPVVIHRG